MSCSCQIPVRYAQGSGGSQAEFSSALNENGAAYTLDGETPPRGTVENSNRLPEEVSQE